MEKKGKGNIYISENRTCEQVNKAKNTSDKQHSPRSRPLLTAFLICKKRQKNFLIPGKLTEANKALRFFSEGIVI